MDGYGKHLRPMLFITRRVYHICLATSLQDIDRHICLTYTMEQIQKEKLTPMSLRKAAKLSQRQVAQALDVQTQTVGNWEKGKVPNLPPSKIKKLCEIFNCSLDDLIEAYEGSSVAQNH
jgi:DNA-binding XRE family transcriptional regulator